MNIISTDVLDTVRIVDESADGGTRLINACDLSDGDKVAEEIAKGARPGSKAAAPASSEVAPAQRSS